ncbi:uncharacterized protein LOC134834133 isoform X2 [Culicoides brevitarsis]|uniref:uncharacterized protein LOC134834133 isoform X2 n=1 Tax=Culicoides brevitarsis TaxID=469753 RepID=UPI00307B44DC
MGNQPITGGVTEYPIPATKTFGAIGEELNTPIIDQTFNGFEYLSSSGKSDESISHNSSSNILTELPHTSPASSQDFWGPPSIKSVLSESDEMIINNNNNNIYETSPLGFEEDYLKLSAVAENNFKQISESYKAKQPLPVIVEDFSAENTKDIEDDVFTKVEFSSQDPANMVPYPLLATETTISDSSDVVTSIKDNNNSVMEHQVSDSICIKETPRPKLKLEMPKIPANTFESNVVGTPDIIMQTLELEKDFDLIRYVNNPENHITFDVIKQEPEFEEPTIVVEEEIVRPKRKSTVSVEQLTALINNASPKRRRTSTRTRASSPATSTVSDFDFNPSSVQSNASSDDSYRTPRRRGRPAKPVASLLNLNEFANLSAEDLKYRELRNKNNEASRRSRMNRRSKEQQMEDEARDLEHKNNYLEVEAVKLERKLAKWQTAIKEIYRM